MSITEYMTLLRIYIGIHKKSIFIEYLERGKTDQQILLYNVTGELGHELSFEFTFSIWFVAFNAPVRLIFYDYVYSFVSINKVIEPFSIFLR